MMADLSIVLHCNSTPLGSLSGLHCRVAAHPSVPRGIHPRKGPIRDDYVFGSVDRKERLLLVFSELSLRVLLPD
jgi:hypothetical protein